MAKSLSLLVVSVNAGGTSKRKAILETLANKVEGFLLYKEICRPRRPCTPNWKGILSHAASVTDTASLLWDVYTDELHSVISSGTSDKPILLIKLNDAENGCVRLKIDENYSNKETFIKEFTEKVECFRESNIEDDKVLENINKKIWIQVS